MYSRPEARFRTGCASSSYTALPFPKVCPSEDGCRVAGKEYVISSISLLQMDERPQDQVDVVAPDVVSPEVEQEGPSDGVHHPAKVMRIATMVRTLLDELRAA